jgi:hypothetical protein
MASFSHQCLAELPALTVAQASRLNACQSNTAGRLNHFPGGCISSPPTRRARQFVVRDAPRTTKWRALDSQGPICQRLSVESTAFSFKLWANAPEGRKRFPISKHDALIFVTGAKFH